MGRSRRYASTFPFSLPVSYIPSALLTSSRYARFVSLDASALNSAMFPRSRCGLSPAALLNASYSSFRRRYRTAFTVYSSSSPRPLAAISSRLTLRSAVSTFRKQHRKTLYPLRIQGFSLAEKEGFEPSIPLWGIHDFQSCALDRATRLLHSGQTEKYSIQLVYYSKCARQSQERLCRVRRFFLFFSYPRGRPSAGW